MSIVWRDHVKHTNETFSTWKRVMSNVAKYQPQHEMARKIKSRETSSYISHRRMVYATHVDESCHTYEWVMSHMGMGHVTRRAASNPNMRWREKQSRATRHSVQHIDESVKSHIWRSHVMSHKRMSHVAHMNESCLMWEWVISRLEIHQPQDKMARKTKSRDALSCVEHRWMGHVTHMKESCHTYEWVMSHIWMSHRLSCVA